MKNPAYIAFLLTLSFFGCTEQGEINTYQGFLNLTDSVEYVGKETCKACHQDKYRTFIHTEMGRSMRKATVGNSKARFHEVNPIYDSALNLYYLPVLKDSLLFIKEYRLGPNQDTTHQRIEQVSFIVGSGHHTNSHLMVRNGYVTQMPLTFYTQKGEWHFPPGFERGNNTRFSRVIGQECMTCHNGYARYQPNSRNRFFDIPEGIDCERCHGPGEIHVKEKQQGKTVNIQKETDYTIVNPAKLSSDLQMDVCQRCHLQGISSLNKGAKYTDFKPGKPLNSMYELFKARFNDSKSSFIMAAHPDRLRMSACFTGSRNRDNMQDLTCITCHNPHVSVKDVETSYFNEKCIKCHQDMKCSEKASIRKEKGDNCVLCHMKKSSSYDIPHVNITDHFIQKRPQSRDISRADLAETEWEKQKDFLKLVCLTNDNPEPYSTALAYLNYFEKYVHNPLLLDSAKVYLDQCQDPNLRVRYEYLRKNYQAVTELASQTYTDPWTNYRIGQAYEQLKNPTKAEVFYQKAVSQALENLDFRNKLAGVLLTNQKLNEAYKILLESLTLNAHISATNNLMGYCLVLQDNLEESERYFLKATKLDPNAIKPIENLASLYLNLGRKEEAKSYIQKLLDQDPDNSGYQKLQEIANLL